MTDPLAVEVAVFSEVELPLSLTDEVLAELVGFGLDLEGACGGWEINLSFVGEDEISRLHDQFMGLPDPTDIITFPFDHAQGGDIAICGPVAEANARENGISVERELAFLIVHGVLHLLGHDDQTTEMRAAMLARQDEILDAWGRISR